MRERRLKLRVSGTLRPCAPKHSTRTAGDVGRRFSPTVSHLSESERSRERKTYQELNTPTALPRVITYQRSPVVSTGTTGMLWCAMLALLLDDEVSAGTGGATVTGGTVADAGRAAVGAPESTRTAVWPSAGMAAPASRAHDPSLPLTPDVPDDGLADSRLAGVGERCERLASAFLALLTARG